MVPTLFSSPYDLQVSPTVYVQTPHSCRTFPITNNLRMSRHPRSCTYPATFSPNACNTVRVSDTDVVIIAFHSKPLLLMLTIAGISSLPRHRLQHNLFIYQVYCKIHAHRCFRVPAPYVHTARYPSTASVLDNLTDAHSFVRMAARPALPTHH